MRCSLNILARTREWVVVDKPPGLLSVPGKGEANQDCVAARVRALFPEATGPLTVHRLDMETSGALLLALDPETHRALSRQFEHRRTGKAYAAILRGHPAEALGEHGEIRLPIRADITRRPIQIVDHEHGREAVTLWRTISTDDGAGTTRVEFTPITGRSHQLRIHAAQGLGCPIVGDRLYGDGAGPRLMLHAAVLEFDDPARGERVRVESPAPF